ncbi:MAG: hypothetical protein FJ279_35895 [Planctomycetes bacterium]|nr:hypothetical protein [Planctomycetota bacterium]MBM4082033.1 hypothetical protein [Planctomycetota bacterium]
MSIKLTPQQLQALDSEAGGLPRVVDPRRNIAYVLVSEAEYKTVREVLDDERAQRAIRMIALRNAAGRMQESP